MGDPCPGGVQACLTLPWVDPHLQHSHSRPLTPMIRNSSSHVLLSKIDSSSDPTVRAWMKSSGQDRSYVGNSSSMIEINALRTVFAEMTRVGIVTDSAKVLPMAFFATLYKTHSEKSKIYELYLQISLNNSSFIAN